MARIVGKIKLDRFDKDFHLLEHREQPMRSWTKGLVEILYVTMSQPNTSNAYASLGDIDKQSRNIIWDNNPFFGSTYGGYQGRDNGRVAAPAGFSPVPAALLIAGEGSNVEFPLLGCDIGIQIGSGTPTVTPADMRLAHRYGHGAHAVDGVDAVYDSQSGDNTGVTITTSNSNMNAQPFMVLHDIRCDSITLKLYKFGSPTQNLTVELRAGQAGGFDGTNYLAVPATGVLATCSIPASSLSTSPGSNITCTWSTPVDLYAGHVYWINCWSAGVDGSDYYGIRLNTSNPTNDRCMTPNNNVGSAVAGAFYAYCNQATTWVSGSSMGNQSGSFVYQINGQSQGEFEYGGCEVVNRVESGTNDAFDIRRFFYNRTASNLTVGEIGINSQYLSYYINNQPFYSLASVLIAHDTLGSPVTVNSGQVLQVTYTIQTQT